MSSLFGHVLPSSLLFDIQGFNSSKGGTGGVWGGVLQVQNEVTWVVGTDTLWTPVRGEWKAMGQGGKVRSEEMAVQVLLQSNAERWKATWARHLVNSRKATDKEYNKHGFPTRILRTSVCRERPNWILSKNCNPCSPRLPYAKSQEVPQGLFIATQQEGSATWLLRTLL